MERKINPDEMTNSWVCKSPNVHEFWSVTKHSFIADPNTSPTTTDVLRPKTLRAIRNFAEQHAKQNRMNGPLASHRSKFGNVP